MNTAPQMPLDPESPKAAAPPVGERPAPHSKWGLIVALALALIGLVQIKEIGAADFAAVLGAAGALAARSFRRRVDWKAGVLVPLGGYFVVFGLCSGIAGVLTIALGALCLWAGFRKPRAAAPKAPADHP
jgi:hypothetical protein